MGIPKYDPAIMKSEAGDQLYHKWLRIHRVFNCSEEFKDFMLFYSWAVDSGFEPGLMLLRRDEEGPYSPENCYWSKYPPKKNKEHGINGSIARFNETVNKIRKAYGMEPLRRTEETQNEEGE